MSGFIQGGTHMRRKDRELTDPEQIEHLLARAQILRVAFCDGKKAPYLVPVNYGYVCREGSYTLYFHGAREGRKYELSKASPVVGFELDADYRLIAGASACGYSAAYQSIVGTGTLFLIEDEEERVLGLSAIMKQATGKADWNFEAEAENAVAVFRLDVEEMTCKAHRTIL